MNEFEMLLQNLKNKKRMKEDEYNALNIELNVLSSIILDLECAIDEEEKEE